MSRGEIPELDESPITQLCREARETGIRLLALAALVAALGFLLGYAWGLR